jgi:hypothetical protein
MDWRKGLEKGGWGGGGLEKSIGKRDHGGKDRNRDLEKGRK